MRLKAIQICMWTCKAAKAPVRSLGHTTIFCPSAKKKKKCKPYWTIISAMHENVLIYYLNKKIIKMCGLQSADIYWWSYRPPKIVGSLKAAQYSILPIGTMLELVLVGSSQCVGLRNDQRIRLWYREDHTLMPGQ